MKRPEPTRWGRLWFGWILRRRWVVLIDEATLDSFDIGPGVCGPSGYITRWHGEWVKR